MLTQIDIYTSKAGTSELWSDVSVKVHGFIMSKLSPEMADALHSGGLMPFSIFTVETEEYFITRVSVLRDEYRAIIEVFDDIKKIRVYGTAHNLNVLHIERAPQVEFASLLSYVTANKYKITFVTPAMYKSKGVVRYDPNLAAYFEAVRQKLELFEQTTITKEEMLAAFDDLQICTYNLSSKKFLTGGKTLLGISGTMSVKLPQAGKSKEILSLLLAYATYTGVGGSTTQGMGGFAIEKQQPRRQNVDNAT